MVYKGPHSWSCECQYPGPCFQLGFINYSNEQTGQKFFFVTEGLLFMIQLPGERLTPSGIMSCLILQTGVVY